jgi:hypothetical protein
MKRNRKSFDYRIKMWFYRLTFKDVKKIIWIALDNISLFIAGLILFFSLFLLPAFFH